MKNSGSAIGAAAKLKIPMLIGLPICFTAFSTASFSFIPFSIYLSVNLLIWLRSSSDLLF